MSGYIEGRRNQRILRQPSDECLCPPFAEGCGGVKPFPNRRTATQASEVRLHRCLVNKHQPMRFVTHSWLTAHDPLPACQA